MKKDNLVPFEGSKRRSGPSEIAVPKPDEAMSPVQLVPSTELRWYAGVLQQKFVAPEPFVGYDKWLAVPIAAMDEEPESSIGPVA